MLLELPHHVGDGGHLLSNRHVDAGHVLAFLVDDRVNRDGRFTDLTVTDDELPLAPAYRDHRVNALQTRLHRLVHGLPRDNAGGYLFNGVRFRRPQIAATVDGVTQRVDHPAHQFPAHRHFKDATRASCRLTFGEVLIVPQHHGAYGVALKVQGETKAPGGELDHLPVAGFCHAVNPDNAVGNAHDRAFVARFGLEIHRRDALLNNVADLGRVQLLHRSILRMRSNPGAPDLG